MMQMQMQTQTQMQDDDGIEFVGEEVRGRRGGSWDLFGLW